MNQRHCSSGSSQRSSSLATQITMTRDLASMTLAQKVGQLFFIGIAGPELDAGTKELLDEVSPGGVCLFARNIRDAAQTRVLLDGIREYLVYEPLLSIDQEGG